LLSIYGCDALEVPIALAEVNGVEPSGSLEVPVALAEVKGAEPGGSLEVPIALAEDEGAEAGEAPVVVVMSGVACRGFSFGVQAMSSSGHSSICSSRKYNS